jgi:hypothetical protein
MRMRHVVLPLSVILCGALAAPAQGEEPPADPPAAYPVDVVSVMGTGCAGAAAAVSGDSTGFSVRYTEFLAGTGRRPSDTRKNCQLVLALEGLTAQQTFAVVRAEHRGTGDLAVGATAEVRTSYYFQDGTVALDRSTWVTPVAGTWTVTDTFVPAGGGEPVYRWRPCGSQHLLNVNTSVRVLRNTSSGYSYLSLNGPEKGSDYVFAVRDC